MCAGLQELELLKRRLGSLKTNGEIINDLTGKSTDIKEFDSQKSKRDIFDFVDQIAKILFGTLDSSDELMNK